MTTARTVRTRRRGRALESAIFDAVIAELGEAGYGRLTMEGVAVRAGTAKSSLYRRWSTREELVIAAVGAMLPDTAALPETGDLRTEMIAALAAIADVLGGPMGAVVTTIIGELDRAPRLRDTARATILDARIAGTRAIFERAAARGEIRPGAITPYVVQAGPSIVLISRIVYGERMTRRDIEDVVDQVVLPIVRPPAPGG